MFIRFGSSLKRKPDETVTALFPAEQPSDRSSESWEKVNESSETRLNTSKKSNHAILLYKLN